MQIDPTEFYWRNKVVVITGASVGIGASIAVKLADAGMVVVGLARRAELVEALNKKVTGPGKIFSRQCDVSDERSVLETFNWIRQKFYVIHVLVNNAGMMRSSLLADCSKTEMESVFNLNVVSAALCIRESMRHMREMGVRSHIIVINSILGHRIPEVPVPLFNVYPATKHAITALCQTTRQEIHFLKLNIKLTSISPGLVDTDLLKVFSHAVDDLPKLQPDDVAQMVLYALETPENVQVEDIILQAIHVPENPEESSDEED